MMMIIYDEMIMDDDDNDENNHDDYDADCEDYEDDDDGDSGRRGQWEGSTGRAKDRLDREHQEDGWIDDGC